MLHKQVSLKCQGKKNLAGKSIHPVATKPTLVISKISAAFGRKIVDRWPKSLMPVMVFLLLVLKPFLCTPFKRCNIPSQYSNTMILL